jgi:putative oxidoreductase
MILKHVPLAVRVVDIAYPLLQKLTLSVALLLMRIIYGWQFFSAGSGKLKNIEKPAAFFAEIGIPLPTLNAYVVGALETFGGLALLVGIASRLSAGVLTVTMVVAYITTEMEALQLLFGDGDPSKVIAAAPFWFLMTCVAILSCGPGWFSVDGIISGLARIYVRVQKPTAPQADAIADPSKE